VIFALGRRSVPAASIKACKFDPDPEMRTVILCMRDVVDESMLTSRLKYKWRIIFKVDVKNGT